MAQWTDPATGVFHDTDNLAYGDQGDTRYWDGKPGAVESVAYDRPKDEPGAKPVLVVVDSNAPGAPPIVKSVGGGDGHLEALTAAGPIPLAEWREQAAKQISTQVEKVQGELVKVQDELEKAQGELQLGTLGLPAVSTVKGWVQANPLPSLVIGLVGLQMLSGGGRRR